MRNTITLLTALFFSFSALFSQTVSTLINQVSKTGTLQFVRDLSGENATVVEGNTVTIKHRVSSKGNNTSARYIKEHLNSYGLTATEINYSSTGRNIVAVKTGALNPTKRFIISAHYDAVSDYGADDNASGSSAVLEAARILSQYTFENTIVFAFWDEEELGLKGAKNYAAAADQNGDNILGVLNMDMIGYDGDNDKRFDIDVRNIANSYQIKNDLLSVVSTHGLNLVGYVVDPGTLDSDHSAFWTQGYSAVLMGEAWSKNDITPGYHSSSDRIGLFNQDYFYNMVKLAVGYITTKGVLMTSTAVAEASVRVLNVYPNPAKDLLRIDLDDHFSGELMMYSVSGQAVRKESMDGQTLQLEVESLEPGLYFIQLVGNRSETVRLKFLKE